MKKRINYYMGFTMMVLGLITYSCQDDDHDFGDITEPVNLTVKATVMNTSEDFPDGDGSGKVSFSAMGEGVLNYKFAFGDNSTTAVSDGSVEHTFSTPGTNEYVVTVVATGTAGTSSSATANVKVFSAFDDPETKQFLTGGSNKIWYVAAALPAHLGVGPSGTGTPDYYAAAPFEKEGEGCFYNDAITFTLDANDNIIFNDNNSGASFFNASYLSVAGGGGSDDQCLPFDTSGNKFVNLAPATASVYPESATTGTTMIIADGGFMSYYVGSSTYEIVEISEDYMMVRTIMGNDDALAWYVIFTTDPDGGASTGGNAGNNPLESEFDTLVWSDEFDADALDTSVWNYEIGNNNGWGNQELQYYTDQNTEISDGSLKINLVKELTSGFDYSSSRIATRDNFEFTYGRVDVRAKLTTGGGTWPAIWMLGANFEEVGWPATGEIDIMEYKGNEPDIIHSTLHYPGHSGGQGVSNATTTTNAGAEFHTYTLEWTAEHIAFAIDGDVFQDVANDASTPFNKPFFVILNVAMGGTFGGAVDPDFQQSNMEIEYVRVYQ